MKATEEELRTSAREAMDILYATPDVIDDDGYYDQEQIKEISRANIKAYNILKEVILRK